MPDYFGSFFGTNRPAAPAPTSGPNSSGLFSRMRKQNAVYWPPTAFNAYGQAGVGDPVMLTLQDGNNYRVRWEERREDFTDKEGGIHISNAIVYVSTLPTGGEVELGGWLWLGDEADLVDYDVPENNPGAFEVRRVDTLPNFKASQFLKTAYL